MGVSNWSGRFPYDPTAFRDFDAFQLYQCCLLRTLFSYTGRPTSQGGAQLHPDLASGQPEVSNDGLTWTFHIKPGLHYAPPLADTEIVAQDFIRAIERALSPAPDEYKAFGPFLGSSTNYFVPLVEGAGDYGDGTAGTISGLEAPDPHTLRVRLTYQSGDVPYFFSLVGTAPVPPNPFHPEVRFGVANGHEVDGYGRFLVSSGPYMIAGSEALDFAKPPEQQTPAWGLDPLVLVRNPSWQRSSDALRFAYPDRIEFTAFTKAASLDEFFSQDPGVTDDYRVAFTKKIESGETDVLLDWSPPNQEVRRYQADPVLKDRLVRNEYNLVRFLSLNVALPPFDDLHVRRAVNYVIDKKRIFDVWQAGFNWASITDHLAPNSTENNLLTNYHPYGTPGGSGDLSAAEAEMRQSRYDNDGDGRCNEASCRGIRVLWRNDFSYPGIASIVEESLAKIGIELQLKLVQANDMYDACAHPRRQATLCQVGWGADFPSASTFFPPLYSSAAIPTGNNYSLLGTTSDQLKSWGYPVDSVPNVDARMRSCQQATGLRQTQCWVDFDQYLMEEIVPAVPLFVDVATWIFSDRVASFSWDQVLGGPALGQIALKPGSR